MSYNAFAAVFLKFIVCLCYVSYACSGSSSCLSSLNSYLSHHRLVLCVVMQGGAPAVATRLSYRPFLTVLQVDPYPLWWSY
jgi:hypothetical protein